MTTPAENLALSEAIAAAVTVVQSSRNNSGLVVDSSQNRQAAIVAGSDIGPGKARILLALCLARGDSQEEIELQFKMT